MSDGDHSGDGFEESSLTTASISNPYKVLGDIADSNGGIGVLGRNTAGSGTTKGVEGRVDSSSGYGLYTPDDAKVEGALRASTGYVDKLGPDTTSGVTLTSNVDVDGNALVDGTGAVTVDDDAQVNGDISATGAQSFGKLGFNGWLSSDQSISGSLTTETIVFDNEVQDDRNEYDTSTGVFTCANDGAYQVDTGVVVENTDLSSGDRVYLEIQSNSTGVVLPTTKRTVHGYNYGDFHLNLSKVLRGMNAGDTIEVQVSTDSSNGATVKGYTATFLTVTQIG